MASKMRLFELGVFGEPLLILHTLPQQGTGERRREALSENDVPYDISKSSGPGLETPQPKTGRNTIGNTPVPGFVSPHELHASTCWLPLGATKAPHERGSSPKKRRNGQWPGQRKPRDLFTDPIKAAKSDELVAQMETTREKH